MSRKEMERKEREKGRKKEENLGEKEWEGRENQIK